MLAPKQNLPADQRKLLKLYKALSKQDRESLFAFAEFLAHRNGEDEPEVHAEPNLLPRPEQESVVAAIKRLSASYPMLDRSELFTDASSLMTSHIMHGRSASDVIDEMEELFAKHYKKNYVNT